MTTQMMPQRAEPLAVGVARRVRGLMGEQRVSGVKLAKRLGMTQATFSRRTTGVVEFSLSEIEVLAAELGVSPGYLLGYAIRDSNPEPADSQPTSGRHLRVVTGGSTRPAPRGYAWTPRIVTGRAS